MYLTSEDPAVATAFQQSTRPDEGRKMLFVTAPIFLIGIVVLVAMGPTKPMTYLGVGLLVAVAAINVHMQRTFERAHQPFYVITTSDGSRCCTRFRMLEGPHWEPPAGEVHYRLGGGADYPDRILGDAPQRPIRYIRPRKNLPFGGVAFQQLDGSWGDTIPLQHLHEQDRTPGTVHRFLRAV